MTGHGQGTATHEDLSIHIEIQSVNRKSLEISVNIPKDYQSLDFLIQNFVKKTVYRGKLTVCIQIQSNAQQLGGTWEDVPLSNALQKIKAFAAKENISYEPAIGDILRLISMQRSSTISSEQIEQVTPLLEKALEKALEAHDTMRLQEGEYLKHDLQARISLLLNNLDSVSSLAPNVVPRYQKQLNDRLEKLNIEVDLNDERILKEIALFADRCDISEEITRLKSHLQQFINSLNEEGPMGRKLDFLCQEIHREWNTIGSKANFLEITQVVIESKNELERIREQVQNIE